MAISDLIRPRILTLSDCPVQLSVPIRQGFPSSRAAAAQIACASALRISSRYFSAMAADQVTENVESDSTKRRFGVLFVCLGNICRSPSAEAVFRHIVEKKGLAAEFNIDSAGTIDYHEGDPADSRMRAAALKRGIVLTSLSRPIKASDFDEFDLIVAMDKKNKADILKAYNRWNKNDPQGRDKVKLMCSYCTKNEETEVPDPYYGGPAGFAKVLDLLEDACEGLLDSIQCR